MTNKNYYFSVNMSYAECASLYDGKVKYAVVTDNSGCRLQLLKKHLQCFITPSGIRGQFRLEVDERNNFKTISKLD